MKTIPTRTVPSKMDMDLHKVVFALHRVCEEYMLPLVDIRFNGDIGLTSIDGVEISNYQNSEDNIGFESIPHSAKRSKDHAK